MRLSILPGLPKGTVAVPQSKSEAHRLLCLAALSEGVSVIRSLPHNDDISATLDGLRAFGVTAEVENGVAFVRGGLHAPDAPLSVCCRESASTLRFLIPFALLTGRETLFTGSGNLLSRPVDAYVPLCSRLGGSLTKTDRGILVRGKLTPGDYTVSGEESSQFASGMLMALSSLKNSRLHLSERPVSRPYLDQTVSLLPRFGVTVSESDLTFSFAGRLSACSIEVGGDWSSGAVWHALNALGADAQVTGLDDRSADADRAVTSLLPLLISGAPTVSLRDTPDLFPLLAAVAAAKNGAAFTDTARLRRKESDRVAAMQTELSKFGVTVEATEDTVRVTPPKNGLLMPKEVLSGHGDHRVVMALASLCCLTGGVLTGTEAVTKSYPAFFGHLKSLGVKAEEI